MPSAKTTPNAIVTHHVRQFAWNDWANAQTLASLLQWSEKRKPKAHRKARLMLAHIVGAELVWLARLAGERSPLPVWPDLDLETCDERLHQIARTWHDVLSAMRPRDLARVARYVNSQGETWSSTVEDILSHVIAHSAYHRGQIASLARDSKVEPARTDFILCVREGILAGAQRAPASAARPRSKQSTPRRRS